MYSFSISFSIFPILYNAYLPIHFPIHFVCWFWLFHSFYLFKRTKIPDTVTACICETYPCPFIYIFLFFFVFLYFHRIKILGTTTTLIGRVEFVRTTYEYGPLCIYKFSLFIFIIFKTSYNIYLHNFLSYFFNSFLLFLFMLFFISHCNFFLFCFSHHRFVVGKLHTFYCLFFFFLLLVKIRKARKKFESLVVLLHSIG